MGKRKLKEADIDEIIRRFVGGDAKTQLAKAFKVTRDTIRKVIKENPQKVATCKAEKKKIKAEQDKTFFAELAELRGLAMDRFKERIETKKAAEEVNSRTLVTAIGVFTDKLGTNGHEEQPAVIKLIFPGTDNGKDV